MSQIKNAAAIRSAYAGLSPVQTIHFMFEQTHPDGTLCIPAWPDDSGESSAFYTCTMNWSSSDCEKITAEFHALCDDLAKLAECYDDLKDTKEENADLLSAPLLNIWDTYIRKFDLGNLAYKQLAAIHKKENNDEPLTDQEKSILNQYQDAVIEDAEKRLGNQPAAYEQLIRTRRLCRLLSLHAPKQIVDHEKNLLAQAMVVHSYALSKSIQY